MKTQKLILLIDDNYGDCKLVELALSHNKSETRLETAANGDEALAYLFREGAYGQAPRPDLIILDWNLPRRNGYEVLGAIKSDRTLTDIPVILFTGGTFVPQMVTACDGKLVFNLLKPDGMEPFFALISEIDDFVNTSVIPPSLISQVAA